MLMLNYKEQNVHVCTYAALCQWRKTKSGVERQSIIPVIEGRANTLHAKDGPFEKAATGYVLFR